MTAGSRSGPDHRQAARRSRTRFVVLGLLAQAPGSVYGLRRRIAESIGYFWQESYGQLFPTVALLEAEGLVEGHDVLEGKRRRRDYAITLAGRVALAGWLREPPASQPERNELLLKVFFVDEADLEALRGFIAAADEEARAQLEAFAGIEAGLTAILGADPRLPFWLLTVRYGALGAEALRRWCDEALAVVAGAEASRE